MIRKAIIVAMTLGAVGTFAAHLSSQRTIRHSTLVSSRYATFGISTTRGRLRLCLLNYPEKEGPFWAWEVPIWEGFHYRRFALTAQETYWELSFPTWSAIAFFAAYPTIAFIRRPHRRRKRRRTLGLCIECGYDLTGNESGVCPECGKPI